MKISKKGLDYEKYIQSFYFRLEKKYRILYEKVRLEKVPADFSMNANCANSELLDANSIDNNCLDIFESTYKSSIR